MWLVEQIQLKNFFFLNKTDLIIFNNVWLLEVGRFCLNIKEDQKNNNNNKKYSSEIQPISI